MSTTRNKKNVTSSSYRTSRSFRPVRRLLEHAIFCMVMLIPQAVTVKAQCNYGYVFLHPFFNNVNWNSLLSQSFVDNSLLCETSPLQFAITASAAQGTAIYTTSGGDWYLSNVQFVNDNCVCCQPEISFNEPFRITIPEGLPLQTTVPFHIINRESTYHDTVLLVASSLKKVYCLHLTTTSGKIGLIDSLAVTLPEAQTITGVWGVPNNDGIDTAIWITGTKGCLLQISFSGMTFGDKKLFTIDESETITCINQDLAGTSSGKIYHRDGSAFILESSFGTAALRGISSRLAVGDNGTIIIRRNDSWELFKTGTTSFRYGNMTANSSGTAVELLDESWNYSTSAIFNTPTSIAKVLPAKTATGLNGNAYAFNDSLLTITMTLHDPDGNRCLPTIRLKGSSSETIADSTSLLRQNPAAVCSTSHMWFDDSIVTVTLESQMVSVSAQAKKGVYNTPCNLWKWQSFTMEKSESWTYNDSLLITLGNDTMKICNLMRATASRDILFSRDDRRTTSLSLLHTGGSLYITSTTPKLNSISIFNPAGRVVWKKTITVSSQLTFNSPVLPSGLHILKADYTDGHSEIHRVVINRK